MYTQIYLSRSLRWQAVSARNTQIYVDRENTFDPLQWRYNEYGGVSNHQPYDCLLNRLFRQIKDNIEAPLHRRFGGEFTSDRWILHTKSQ